MHRRWLGSRRMLLLTLWVLTGLPWLGWIGMVLHEHVQHGPASVDGPQPESEQGQELTE